MRKYIDIIEGILNEGKVFEFRTGSAAYGKDVLAYENPTVQQIMTAIQRCGDDPYIRGLCYMNKRLIVWNGFLATHDDVRQVLFPDKQRSSSEISTFEIASEATTIFREDMGKLKINMKQIGDYDINQCRYFQNIIKALPIVNDSIKRF